MLNRLIIQAQTGLQWFVELKLRLVTDRERSSKIPLQIRQLVRVRRTHYTSAVWSSRTRCTIPFAERGGLLCSLSRRQGQFHEFSRKQDIERVTAGSTRCVFAVFVSGCEHSQSLTCFVSSHSISHVDFKLSGPHLLVCILTTSLLVSFPDLFYCCCCCNAVVV